MRLWIAVLLAVSPALASADDGLKNETELGMVVTGGNTDTDTLTLKEAASYNVDVSTYKFSASFLRTSSQGIEQALTWGVGGRYERAINPRWSLFLGQLAEGNVYQGIGQRYATDLGGKYVIQNLEKFKWIAEAGYRFARENYTNDSSQSLHFARLYSEAQYIFAPTVTAKFWAELLPNLTNWQGFQLNTELSLNAGLSEIFSFKSGYLLRWNNQPPAGATSKTDRFFTTSLVARI